MSIIYLVTLDTGQKKLNLEFDLTKEWIRENLTEACPVNGVKFLQGKKGFSDTSPSIDKINPKLGYTQKNCRIISWRINSIKNNGTLEEFQAIIKYLEQYENL